MRFADPLQPAVLLRRYKRFLADVELPDGTKTVAHVPNTGSLMGVVRPGAAALLRHDAKPSRKLRWTLVAVAGPRGWIGVDTMLAMPLVREAIEAGRIRSLAGYGAIRAEVPYGPRGRSRIDFLLSGGTGPEAGRPCYVEVKNTTLVRARSDGVRVAAFPDAPTARGRKHLEDLLWAVGRGHRAVIVFSVQRSDCDRFAPADDIDPEYGRLLRSVVRSGVEAVALAARRVGRRGIALTRCLPVDLA